MQVENNTTTGVVQDLVVDGQKINVIQDQRPRIQNVAGKNLVTGFDQSLHRLEWATGRVETFAFGTDSDLDPNLTIARGTQTERSFTWDTTNGRIKTGGPWTYALKQINDLGDMSLSRTDASKHSEAFSSDGINGVTSELKIDGTLTRTFCFTSGPLRGKVRKIIVTAPGQSELVDAYTYDETGNLIRRQKGNYLIDYNTHGKAEKVYVDGRLILTTTTTNGKEIYLYDN